MAHEVLTTAESRAADRAAVELGVESFSLMRTAGEALATAASARWSRRPVLVLCGPGDNGGDGYVAARELRELGWIVRVAALAPPATADARRALELWGGPVASLDDATPAPDDLVIDALFGTGLSREIGAPARTVFEAAAAARCPIIAADLPSGLAGDSGKPIGFAPHAALTVTFHRKKPAHLLEPGRRYCGEVLVCDIGIADRATPPARLWENHPDLWLARFPWPDVTSHKHARGRLGIVSGGATATGAARLAARAGLRSGAGLVRLYCPLDVSLVHAPHLEAVMLQPFHDAGELEGLASSMDAALIGPAAGVDDLTVANVRALARTGSALIIDADALTVFHDDPARLFALLDRDDVLTPHAGEFERMFPGLLCQSQDKISAVRTAARTAGAVVLLKGADTVVAAPDGRAVINSNGSPWLATAGSGDVLAGLIAGLIAQGLDSFDAACAGVWMHAAAGGRFGPGLIAEDLPEMLPAVLSELFTGSRAAG